MPYSDSNIPSKIFYSLLISEILRIARTKKDPTNLITVANLLLIRMKKQGSECVHIILILRKVFGKHLEYFISLQILLINLLSSYLYYN